MQRILFVCALCSLFAAAAYADVPSTATGIATIVTSCNAEVALTTLTDAYNAGDWDDLQKHGRALLDALRAKAASAQSSRQPERPKAKGTDSPLEDCHPARMQPAPAAETEKGQPHNGEGRHADMATQALDYTKRWVAVQWIGSDVRGDTQLLRVVIHSPAGEAYSSDLPGVDHNALVEVYLSYSTDARAVSLYTSTPEKNDFVEQLPAFLQAIFNPLAGLMSGVLPALGTLRADTGPHLVAAVRQASLPLRRAKVHLQAAAKDATPNADFTDAVNALATAATFNEAANSLSARAQVSTLRKTLPEAAALSCAASQDLNAVPSSRKEACLKALDDKLAEAYKKATEGTPTKEDLEAVKAVDKRFRALAVEGLSTKAELDLTFRNKPLTHFTLGAGSAVIGRGKFTRPRAKLDDKTGNLTSDPMGRVITTAFVNWSPKGYDAESSRLKPEQRFRAFFGAAVTPDFGVVAGGNVLIVRGVGVVAGWGYLFAKGADEGELGNPPTDSTDPFKLARSPNTWFVGLSYNFK
jgi:hypothetical protein